MIPAQPAVGKVLPPPLRAYHRIPWLKLGDVAWHLLSLGDAHAKTQHVFFIACEIATIYRYKKGVREALESWCWSNRTLQKEVPRLVDTAYAEVYRRQKNDPTDDPTIDDKMRELSTAGRKLYHTLYELQSNPGDWFDVSLDQLAEKAAVSRATVKRQVTLLKTLGLVEVMSGKPEGPVTKGMLIGSNLYRLVGQVQ